MNTYGTRYRLTTFGESHGPAIGGVIDGMPAGVSIDMDAVQAMVDRRRPGTSPLVTQRREADKVEVLSGIFEGKTTGTPIGFIIRNNDARSGDYEHLRNAFRPNHADEAYFKKYGIRDHRGGGRASARETACRVVAGALAMQVLTPKGIIITARLVEAGGSRDIEKTIAQAKSEGDSVGGVVECCITGIPTGLGEPVYGKLSAALASAMMSINAARGFELGGGFQLARMRGSECLDRDLSGGILGGISTGQPIVMSVAFKPTPTLGIPVTGRDPEGNDVVVNPRGRHDPCVAVRAVPVVEAMAAITILDYELQL